MWINIATASVMLVGIFLIVSVISITYRHRRLQNTEDKVVDLTYLTQNYESDCNITK